MIGVLAVACVTPLGEDPAAVCAALARGVRACLPAPHLQILHDPRAAMVPGPDLGPWLKRKKDLRLLPRAAVLALPAAGRAMRAFSGDPEDLPLMVAVGREPPDSDDAEASLAAMATDGRLDHEKLGTVGRALYPPLLPLRTLPNMILAHVSIAHGIRGENGTWAGGPEAGRQALDEARRWVSRGYPQVLVGAAYAGTDLASARDRLRLRREEPPGEAAIFSLIGEGGVAIPSHDPAWEARFRECCGVCGPVEGLAGLLRCAPTIPSF